MSSRSRKPTPFDRLLKQQCQKGVGASKSTGVVGKWGTASFTSVRNPGSNVGGVGGSSGAGSNGNASGPSGPARPKPKKFFKSRQKEPEPPVDEDDGMSDIITPVIQHQQSVPPVVKQQQLGAAEPLVRSNSLPLAEEKPKRKFFTSSKKRKAQQEVEEAAPVVEEMAEQQLQPRRGRHQQQQQQLHEQLEERAPPPPKVPPLKLRIKTVLPPPPPEPAPETDTASSAESEEEDVHQQQPEVSNPEPSPPEDSPVQDDESEEDQTIPSRDKSEPAEESWLSEEISQHRRQLEAEFTTSQSRGLPEAAVPSPPESPPLAASVPPPDPTPAPSLDSPPSLVNKSLSEMTYSRRAYTRNKQAGTAAQPKVPEEQPTLSDMSEEPAPATRTNPGVRSYGSRRNQQPADSQWVTTTTTQVASTRGCDRKTASPEPEVAPASQVPDPPPAAAAPPIGLQRAATEPAMSSSVKADEDIAASSPATADSQPAVPTQSQPAAPPSKKFFTKKRSIFKSKSANNGGGGATSGKSLYKHNWNQDDAAAAKEDLQSQSGKSSASTGHFGLFDDDDFGDNPSTSSAGPTGTASVQNMSFSSNNLVKVKSTAGGPTSAGDNFGFDDEDNAQEIVSVKCPKGAKGYYTVIKNVKKAHQIQDSGEFQEFNDDVEYILEGLGSHNNLSTRCLSTITFASKCMEPAFRMHLRAHGTVTKFFAEIRDAPANPSLALCASTVLFVLSQDRLNMDLDRESLELMLNLLDTDSRIKDALDGAGMNKRELEKNKQKVQELVAAMKAKGRAVNLNLDKISADHLSMETLLSLTSKRAGEWFGEELRQLGGLDHLVRTMSDCLDFLTADEISMWTEPLHNKLKKAERVLKVLESVTTENEENCQYLLEHESGKFLKLIHSFFKLIDEEVPLNPSTDIQDKESVSYTLREALLTVIKVYINLVHDYKNVAFGSRLSGEQEGVFDLILHCMFVVPDYLPEQKRFDILVLSLTFLINLIEHCKTNRTLLFKTLVPQKANDLFAAKDRATAPEEFVRLFLLKEESAQRHETKTDNILDGKEDGEGGKETKKDAKQSQEDFIDETVKKLVNKAGKHMEDTLIASYLTLIIGHLILEEKDYESHIRSLLPDNNFSLMAAVLQKFFNFVKLTASSSVTSNRGLKATEMILKHLEAIDKEPDPEAAKKEVKDEDNFDDLTLFDVSKDEEDDSINASSTSAAVPGPSIFDNSDFGKLL